MATNIEKYLLLASENSNGVTYKNDDAFKRENDDICYISEYALEDLKDLFDEGKDLTDAELIALGYAESYNTIIKQVIYAELESDTLTPYDIAEDLYYCADWAYISTYINERKYNED